MVVLEVNKVDMLSCVCRYAAQRSQPPSDLSQDILAASVVHENGLTTLSFQRQRVTGDPDDIALNQCVYFLYAWGGMFSSATGMLQYHGSTRRGTIGTTMVCLPSAQQCTGIVHLTYEHACIAIMSVNVQCQ